MNLNKYRICPATAYPENLQVEVSRACSLGCPQCRRTYLNRAGGGAISPAVIEKLEPALAQADLLGLSGWGETLASPMVWRLLDAAHWCRVNPCLTTNGTLLSEEVCGRLVERQLGQATISLDAGTAEGYRRLRPGGELESVVGNIHRLARVRAAMRSQTPFLVVTFNFYEASAEEFPHFVRLAATLPILKAVVHPYYPPEPGNVSREFRLSERAREAYEEGLALAARLGVPLECRLEAILDHQLGRPNPECEGKVFLPSLDEIRQRKLFPTCRCAWDFPFVDVEGNVYPCTVYPEPLGNILTTSFGEVWDNERFIQFRRDMVTQRPGTPCLFCHKTMWYPNHLNDPVPEHLSLAGEGLVGLGWYPPEPVGRGQFCWSRGSATVYLRNTFKPKLYFVAQALRETRLDVAINGRAAGTLTVNPYWGVCTLHLPPLTGELLRASFTCPDAQDDPASNNPGCRMRLLGVAVAQAGLCQSGDDPEPRRALRRVRPSALPLSLLGRGLNRWMRTLLMP